MKIILLFILISLFVISANNFSTGPCFHLLCKGNNFLLTDSSSILKINSIVHKFSRSDKLDTFIVFIKGKSILEAEVTFIIKDFNGIEIFKETFPSIDLIDYGLENGIDESDSIKTTYIKERIANFFNEENFIEPAIKLKEEFDEDYSDKVIWEDIHSDQTSVGFHYLIGEEDNRSIAFSKKMRKVVIYFNCC